ncbi:d54f2052-21c7-47ec-8ee1-faa9c2bcf635 [Sclerotinia trifoliorum]|uniref:Presequence translocated-associated motor subunit PAM17 n=1 Tax=Sclerotinia trifoliorum TaxID=28548 RepID=A0A8H2VNP9_9HELO|nr:d54f2052-21c7-47ec-8ee1-faa9c2bcf635 [Sclerotinia trifoliorum]
MLYSAPTLRTAAATCRIQPSVFISCTYQTAASSTPLRAPDNQNPSSRRRVQVPSYKRNVTFKPTSRSASTASTSTSPSKSSQTSSAAQTEVLNWNTFFKLRRTRRWFQLGSSIGTGFGGFAIGAQILTHTDMDALVGQIPLDPFITLGLVTFACGGAGWLTGPILGTAAFNLKNRKFRQQMDVKEKEFYARVKKYRVDPSASSMANPVPDYYGEKISSVAGYRQWLKDQRAFNRKRQTYV